MKRIARFFMLAVLATCSAGLSPANADTKIRFSLDWIPGSVHAPFFIALYKGYYKAEGLDVTIFPGKGTVGLIQQMASGVYDMGYPEINILTDFDAKNPDKSFPDLMMGYEQAPAAIVYLKSSGMTKPSQLEGKSLGAVATDGTFKLFPVFAEHAGFDPKKVKIKYIDPKLRESLLAKRDVDAIVGQVFNSVLQLKADGIPEDQVGAFLYRDYGLDLYGNGVAASPAFLKAHPDAVKGFIRATIKGFKEMAKDPKLAVEMTMKFEPLLNAQIEKDRLALAMKCCIVTPNVLKNGFGDVDEARLKRGIALVAKSDGLPRVPKAKEIFDPSFLPPQKDRMLN